MRIVERSDKDLDREAVELFNECRPYLDKGYGFYKAVRTVKGLSESTTFSDKAWYKRFRDYAVSQGYKPLR